MATSPETSPGKIIARAAAGAALTMSAGHVSASFDKLATWFLAAFGAGLALALTHLTEASNFISTSSLACGFNVFICASFLCLGQRYIAMIIAAAAAAAKDGREMGEKFAQMDIQEFVSQMKAGVPILMRPFINVFMEAILKGDFAAGGRLLIRLALFQGLLASAEVIWLLVTLWRIVGEIKT